MDSVDGVSHRESSDLFEVSESHRICSVLGRSHEENVYEILNGHAHRVYEIYEDSKMATKLRVGETTDYSCFDYKGEECLRITARNVGRCLRSRIVNQS